MKRIFKLGQRITSITIISDVDTQNGEFEPRPVDPRDPGLTNVHSYRVLSLKPSSLEYLSMTGLADEPMKTLQLDSPFMLA